MKREELTGLRVQVFPALFGVLIKAAAPSNNWDQLFDLSKMDWYYGSIDRREAEKYVLYQ